MKRKNLILLVTNIWLLLPLQACTSSVPVQLSLPAVPVYTEPACETAVCRVMNIRDTRTLRFTYQAAREETLFYPENNVHYSAFYVSAGTAVRKGDLLCELDPEDYPDLLLSAQNEIVSLEETLSHLDERLALDLERQQIQHYGSTNTEKQNAKDAVNLRYGQKRQELEDQISILKKRVRQYEDKLYQRQLYAPFDGVVTYVYTPDPDDLSKTSRKIVTVTDSSQMLFTVQTEYCPYFQPDTEFTLTINEESRPAVVISSDPETNMVALSLKTPDYSLKDGTAGTLELSLQEKEQVPCIPKRALSTINGAPVVYVPGEMGFRTYREVETGISNDFYVEIVSGLEEGDVVLLPD